jgi:hypothetical protein
VPGRVTAVGERLICLHLAGEQAALGGDDSLAQLVQQVLGRLMPTGCPVAAATAPQRSTECA